MFEKLRILNEELKELGVTQLPLEKENDLLKEEIERQEEIKKLLLNILVQKEAEIARLQEQVASLEEIRVNQLAQMKYYQEETAHYCLDIARLQAQVATYERIITSNIEDSKRVGDSAKPYMNEVKSWQIVGNTIMMKEELEADE